MMTKIVVLEREMGKLRSKAQMKLEEYMRLNIASKNPAHYHSYIHSTIVGLMNSGSELEKKIDDAVEACFATLRGFEKEWQSSLETESFYQLQNEDLLNESNNLDLNRDLDLEV